MLRIESFSVRNLISPALFSSKRYLLQALQSLLIAYTNLSSRHSLLEKESYAKQGANEAFEKALIFTIDAYSHSGLVRDDEIIQKLQETLRYFKRKVQVPQKREESATGLEAYVLLNCDLGLEDAISKELMALPEVVEVKGLFGVYDIIVRINADSEEDIKTAIGKIRSMTKIKSSLTMMVIESQESGIVEP